MGTITRSSGLHGHYYVSDLNEEMHLSDLLCVRI